MFLKNRPARYEFAIEDTLTAGMALLGSEIKSIREGKVTFEGSFCAYLSGELWVRNLTIAEYINGGYAGHKAVRDRKLLLTKRELRKWEAKMKEKGLTIVPLSIAVNEKGLAKMEIGLGRGKKLHDKRDTIKKRDVEREIRRSIE